MEFSVRYLRIVSRGWIELATEVSAPYRFLVPSEALENIVCALTQLPFSIHLLRVNLSAVMCSITAFHNKMFLGKSVFSIMP